MREMLVTGLTALCWLGILLLIVWRSGDIDRLRDRLQPVSRPRTSPLVWVVPAGGAGGLLCASAVSLLTTLAGGPSEAFGWRETALTGGVAGLLAAPLAWSVWLRGLPLDRILRPVSLAGGLCVVAGCAVGVAGDIVPGLLASPAVFLIALRWLATVEWHAQDKRECGTAPEGTV